MHFPPPGVLPRVRGWLSKPSGTTRPILWGAADVEKRRGEPANGPSVTSEPDDTTYLGSDRRQSEGQERSLADFTTKWDTVRLVPLAILIGALGAGVSLVLLGMIGFFTNLFYYQRVSFHLVSPNANSLGAIAFAIPIAGGLVVGLMARFGSEQIRGHGIPEAMENVLVNGSRVQPRLAVLKPISSAISIGTGGPFGAEGPIILTGGALGSIAGQLFRLTASQRRALLVAGAAAGMSAVFGTPVAATLFGVELLAFEWKPRSMVLIGLAAGVADTIRIAMAHAHLVAPQPLFPVPAHAALSAVALGGAALIGLVTGLAAWVITQAVYTAEDGFMKLRGHVHWMWWPAIGGVLIGVGGLVDPRALGVGYNTIHAELLGKLGLEALALLLVTKLVIWAGSLGSGTSGGILAPVLMMGAALGSIVGHVLPGSSPAVWALIGMGGALGGVTRSPFTAIVFSFELTHDQNSLLALLIAATSAHLVSVLVLKRSILTEKVARRGFHVMREYAVDPLEAVFVREAMDADVYSVEPSVPVRDLDAVLRKNVTLRRQRLYPVVASSGTLVGVIPLSRLLEARTNPDQMAGELMVSTFLVAYRDETLRQVAERMAVSGVGVLPVVERANARRMHGLITQFDLLTARQRLLEEERSAERILHLQRIRKVAASPLAVATEHPKSPIHPPVPADDSDDERLPRAEVD